MPENTGDISRSRRFVLLFIAWLVTAIATIPFTVYPIFFPIGLGRLLGEQTIGASAKSWYMLVGWSVYIALTIGAYLSRRRLIYFILYFVLCLLLALNCVGCREIMSDIGSIKG
jgi:hypothetical protein